jgi:hypothetical protein
MNSTGEFADVLYYGVKGFVKYFLVIVVASGSARPDCVDPHADCGRSGLFTGFTSGLWLFQVTSEVLFCSSRDLYCEFAYSITHLEV